MQESKFVHKQGKGELWRLKRLDSGKDKNWYGMLFVRVKFQRPNSHAYKRNHTLSINILMPTHKVYSNSNPLVEWA